MTRLLDIVLSCLALFFLAPLLLPVIIILKITGEGEVFYIQERAGIGGRTFGLYKFATMVKNSPNIGAGEITVRDDPRVLPFGKFLRKTKLNELPQLWNILLGHMSIVGPRPMVPNTYALYSKETREDLDKIRPGLTGIGSIIFRDEERHFTGHENPMEFYRNYIIPYKSDLELWYLRNKTVWLYLKIILVTAFVIIVPSTNLVTRLFVGIPKAPQELL